MQVRELHHVSVLHKVSVSVDILQRQHLVMVVFQFHNVVDLSFRVSASIRLDRLLVLVLRNSHMRFLALSLFESRRNPSILRILDVDESVLLLRCLLALRALAHCHRSLVAKRRCL